MSQPAPTIVAAPPQPPAPVPPGEAGIPTPQQLIQSTRQSAVRSRHRVAANIVFAGLLMIPFVLAWVGSGHAPFVNDEPQLVADSLEANSQWRLASSGMKGSFGLPYGPTPLHVYQVLLLMSGPDIESLVWLRAIVFIALIAVGLMWFASELKLWRWLVPVLLISPMVVIESFHLWDNTFAIPASILTLACYARFVRTHSTVTLLGWVLGCLVLLSIHPASLPLVLAIAADALWHHRRVLWSGRVAIGLVFIAFALTMRGYVLNLAEMVSAKLAQGLPTAPTVVEGSAVPAPMPMGLGSDSRQPLLVKLSRPAAAAFALSGATVLGGFQMEIDFADLTGWLGALGRSARQISAWLLLALTATGAAIALWHLVRGNGLLEQKTAAARQTVLRISIVALALAVVLFAGLKVAQGFHYFNGLWIVFAALIWLAVDRLRPRMLAGALLVVLGTCSLVVNAACLRHLEQNGGTRGVYGPDLSQQLGALRQATASGQVIYTNVPNFVAYPRALRTLAQLQHKMDQSQPALPQRMSTHVEGLVPVIEYANPQDPLDARLAVRMAPEHSLAKSDFRRIDLLGSPVRGY